MSRRAIRRIAGLLAGTCVLAAGLRAETPPAASVTPNLLVEVNKDLANAAAAARPIDQTGPINERKGRLTINGVQHTQAFVGIDFVPTARGAVFDLLMRGGTTANTDACQGKVCLNLTTRVSYYARMQVYADENGVRALTCADSMPSLDENTLNCLSTKFRGPLDPLVRNIATKVYNKKKAQIESDLIRDARTTINKQFDENAAKQFAETNAKYEDRVHGPMVKRGIWPQRIKVLCSDTELGIRALLNDPTGKGRTFAPVPVIQGSPAIAVRVEESILNNATHTMFAGKKFTGEELDKEFNTLLKPLMGDVKTTDTTDKPFSITFPPEKPIEIHFDKQMVTIILRGSEFTAGDNEYSAWDTKAVYKLRKSEKGFIAERIGELEIFPPGFQRGKDKLGALDQGLRKLLEKKFGRVLKPKFEMDEVTFEEPLDRIGMLVTTQVESDKGWLVLAWKRVAK
jgi:hypothetical protein